jgi:hypothetical protein
MRLRARFVLLLVCTTIAPVAGASRRNTVIRPVAAQPVLRAEHFLMDTGGGNIVQLMHLNTPGFPEYIGRPSTATKATWSPEGTRLLVAELVIGGGQIPGGGNVGLWALTFSGACGTER